MLNINMCMFLSAQNHYLGDLHIDDDHRTGYASLYRADESLAAKCLTGPRRCGLLEIGLQNQVKSLEQKKTQTVAKITTCKASINNNENIELNQKLIAYYEQGLYYMDLALQNLQEYSIVIEKIKKFYKKAQEHLKDKTIDGNNNAEELCNVCHSLLTKLSKYYFFITEIFLVIHNYLSYFIPKLLLNPHLAKNDPTLIQDYEELATFWQKIAQECQVVIAYYREGNATKGHESREKVANETIQAQQRTTVINHRFDKILK